MHGGRALVILLTLSALAVQANETGKPFMTIYTAKETGGHFQNWAITQDDRGVMYIGNGFGVQEFDGSSWRMILSPNQSFARAFDKDENGRIYVGSLANLGYLVADDHGELQYKSLMDYIKTEDRAFNYIRTVQATPEGIYFQAQEILFRFRPAGTQANQETWQVQVWRPKVNFSYTFWTENTLYVQEIGTGLMKMVGDSLVPIRDGQQFANDRMQIMLPFPGKPHHYLLGTYHRGLFTWDGNKFDRFITDSDPALLDGPLYVGVLTPDSCFAIGSTSTGFFVIDTNGKTKLHLTKESGFTSNTVICLYVDQQKNIWVGMDGSIAILEYSTPLSLFDVAQGSGANDFLRHHDIFYAATNDGVYYLDRSDSKFKHVTGIAGNAQAFYFSVINDELFIPTGSGIYRLEGNQAHLAVTTDALSVAFNCLARSKQDSNLVFGGMLIGLGLLRYDAKNPKRLEFIGQVDSVHEYISRNVIETEPGIVWPSTFDVGALRLSFDGKNFRQPMVERFGTEQGLPIGTVTVFDLFDKLAFVTKKGIYQFNPHDKTFSPDPRFAEINLGRNPDEGTAVADRNGNYWACLGKESIFFKRQADGTMQVHSKELARFADEPATVIYPDQNDKIWFATADYAIRFSPDQVSVEQPSFKTLIRSVLLANDSVLYHGYQTSQIHITDANDQLIPFGLNALRFEFSATSYLNTRANEFRSKLEGFEKTWSAWSQEAKRNYTNLSAGTYRFRVQSKNIYSQMGDEAVYAFIISTPWYATWWAWLLYTLISGGLIFAIVRLRTHQLKERSRALEKIIKDRTTEIQEQKRNIEQLSIIGRDITDNLSIKEIINTIYENVNTLMDAPVFGIGMYQEDKQNLIFPATIEKGATLAEYAIPLSNEDRLAVWCFKHQQDVIINDYEQDCSKNIEELKASVIGKNPQSILYLPLQHKGHTIGVITAQSFNKKAYTEYHLNVLRNLATYSAIALENADAYRRLNELLLHLKGTQEKLITQSKLAALGALTAGIAHEIKNPLNFVNNFAELITELAKELEEELAKEPQDKAVIADLLSTLIQNADKIAGHGKRADSIVKSMLQHSRGKTGERQPTDINAMLEEDINLAYHGMRAQNNSFNIKIETDLDPTIHTVNVVPQDISRVFLNILSNGFYEAYNKKVNQNGDFTPLLIVKSHNFSDAVEICIRDNGNGIAEAIKDNVFTPFFTTKPSGQGIGLGLSLSYDIVVHGHNGQLFFETKEGSYTEFVIRLPR